MAAGKGLCGEQRRQLDICLTGLGLKTLAYCKDQGLQLHFSGEHGPGATVGVGQGQQVAYQTGHAQTLPVGQHPEVLCSIWRCFLEGGETAVDDGQRRAQFVRGGGDERSLLFLALLNGAQDMAGKAPGEKGE